METRTILTIITDSWGEVDWILPVLTALKEKYGATILVYFMKPGLREKGRMTEDLEKCLCSTAVRIIGPEQLGIQQKMQDDEKAARLCSAIPGPVDFLLHDYAGLDMSHFYRAFPGAQVVVFPHGTPIDTCFSAADRVEIEKKSHYKSIPRNAVMLLGTPADTEHYRSLTGLSHIDACGYPKFEPEWVARLTKKSSEFRGKPRILFLPIPKRKLTAPGSFESLLTQTARLCRAYSATLAIKVHPRQQQQEILSAIPATFHAGIAFENRSVLGCSADARLALCWPSSSCMDAIAAGIPVIEFFDFTNQRWNSFIQKENRTTSIYRDLGLVLPADTLFEASRLIRQLLSSELFYQHTIRAQQKALRTLQKNYGAVMEHLLKTVFAVHHGTDSTRHLDAL